MTSIKVGCATRSLYAGSGPEAKIESRLTIIGKGIRTKPPLRRFIDKARHIVQTALLFRVQRFRNDLYKAVIGTNTRPIVLSMIARSY